MKFTQKQLIEFAQKAGVPVVEVVADDYFTRTGRTPEADDYNLDGALQEVHKAITPILQPTIEAALMNSVDSKVKGKYTGEMYTLLAKESGLTRAELAALPVNEAAKMAFTHITSKLGGDTTALQQEIKDLMKKQTDAIAAIEVDRDNKVNEANQKYINRDIKAFLADNIVGKAPLLETADKGYYSELLMNQLQNKYHLSYDEVKKAVSPFKKDNHAVPALNEAGTSVIDFMKEFEAIAKPAGVWKTDQRSVNPADKMRQQQTDQYKKPEQQVEGPRSRRSSRPTPEQVTAKMKEIEEQ